MYVFSFPRLDVPDRFPTPSMQRPRQGSGVSQSLAQASAGGSMDKLPHSRPVAREASVDTTASSTHHPQTLHRSRKHKRTQDCAVVVAWLESLHDMVNFPIKQLSQSLHGLMPPPPVSSSVAAQLHASDKASYLGRPYLPVIFVYPLPSGLYRIHTWIPAARFALGVVYGIVTLLACLSWVLRHVNRCHCSLMVHLLTC